MTEIVATKSIKQLAQEQMARTTPVQLGLWPDDKRGAPNAILRAAVFSASTPVARSNRERYVDRLLPVLPPYAVFYTGPTLYQPELDVCLELWDRCKRTTAGNEVTFRASSFLKSIGRHAGKSDHAWLGDAFSSLMEPTIRVMQRNPSGGLTFIYGGHLVDEAFYDRDRDGWYARVSPTMSKLFAPDAHTWLDSSTRLALGRGFLAKWLHAYFSTHAKPLPMSVQRLLVTLSAPTSAINVLVAKLLERVIISRSSVSIGTRSPMR